MSNHGVGPTTIRPGEALPVQGPQEPGDSTPQTEIGKQMTQAMRVKALYDRLRLSISDIRETGRISAVESRCLNEMVYDLVNTLQAFGHHPEKSDTPVIYLKRDKPLGRWVIDEERTNNASKIALKDTYVGNS